MHEIRFYNSLTKQKEVFAPLENGRVKIYNCGPTVYKRQHIGNLRRYLFSDFLRRFLELMGYQVYEVMNITDVGHLTQDELDTGEDKMEKQAALERTTPEDIANTQTRLFFDDLNDLNIQAAHEYPRATQHITQMIDLISELIKKENAYVTSTGVYFDVTSFENYGALSGNNLEHLDAGSRVDIRGEKRHPADFALWKTDDTDHVQLWDSPWGRGYPGWHIECSAMSMEYLGETIDIHTGGVDNKFPHHENEIAQSEGATGKKFVNFWLHNEHMDLGGKKLSKRAGEQITLDTLRTRGFSPAAFRLLVLSAHYRSKMNFSWVGLAEAQKNLESWHNILKRLNDQGDGGAHDDTAMKRFRAALSDDLNTPKALAVVMDYIRESNARLDDGSADDAEIWATLLAFDKVLGIFEGFADNLRNTEIPGDVRELVREREIARANNDFTRADELRDQIAQLGFVIKDTENGPDIHTLSSSP